jgi:enoyl-CoA hydratase/carnithine racemase
MDESIHVLTIIGAGDKFFCAGRHRNAASVSPYLKNAGVL